MKGNSESPKIPHRSGGGTFVYGKDGAFVRHDPPSRHPTAEERAEQAKAIRAGDTAPAPRERKPRAKAALPQATTPPSTTDVTDGAHATSQSDPQAAE